MRAVIGKRALERTAASSGTMSRFETEILTQDENIDALATLNSGWVSKAVSLSKAKKVILDIDSSESPVHGNQEGSAYNGHFESTCYHPLFFFNNFGDCEGAVLRPGNVHSADGWKEFLSPIVDKYEAMDKKLYMRGDAAFASPDIYEYLEDNSILYAIRLKANNNLHREIDHLMTRPVGRPSRKPKVFHDFPYASIYVIEKESSTLHIFSSGRETKCNSARWFSRMNIGCKSCSGAAINRDGDGNSQSGD